MLEDTIGDAEPQLVRLSLPDQPGRLALVASRFAAHDVNILRVEVVAGGDGSAVDDLLVVGGNLALALEEARGECRDPRAARARRAARSGNRDGGCASRRQRGGEPRRGAASPARRGARARRGRWRCASARCGPRLASARRLHHGVVAADPEDQPCLARSALARSRAETASPQEPWAPAAYSVALGMGRVLIVPAGRPPFLALALVRHDAFPFVEAEVERVQALLRVAVGILGALGERSVRAPLDAPEHVARVQP